MVVAVMFCKRHSYPVICKIFSDYSLMNIIKSCRYIARVSLNSGYVSQNVIKVNKCSHHFKDTRLLSSGPDIASNISYEKLETVKDKILYNSLLDAYNMKSIWFKKMRAKKKLKNQRKELNALDIPVFLRYVTDMSITNLATSPVISKESVQLPYSINAIETLNSTKNNTEITVESKCGEIHLERKGHGPNIDEMSSETTNWMSDYEYFDERGDNADVSNRPWELNYGTPDSSVPISKVPCGGCGALLHCQDTAIPGYLPSELFVHRTEGELHSMKCQRCHFMLHYGMALNVNVSAEEYPRLMAHIKDKRALAILMVDLMDFPCSIWPQIIDIIGTKRPIVVVGNKVDLLPQDSPGFLNHVKGCLETAVQQSSLATANIKHIALISATTGYGIEELITKLHTAWNYKGDVYLLGCTNVGKSTLFNALLQSDYCKVQAVDLIQRATTSPWPGTTLNLLKFPILRPSGWRMYQRTQRLIHERSDKFAEQKLRKHQLRKTKDLSNATLLGHIGRTFYDEKNMQNEQDPFSVRVGTPSQMIPNVGLNPKDKRFIESHWCYDTPGTIQPDQVINLLTIEELMITLPKTLLIPRTLSVKPGNSLLIAGLGRLDYIQGKSSIRFTVFASKKLPLTVCWTADCDEVYSSLLGTKLLQVPCGGEERINQWPGLSPHRELLEVIGKDWTESAADVILSSSGWVAVTSGEGHVCQLRAWTPHGRGIYLRQPALLRYAVNLHGARVRKSPAYRIGKAVYIKN